MSQSEMPATVDRISDLPDEILCHILSFLPTKLAYATCVLSKRWTPLCHFLTALRFDDEGVRDVQAFLRFRGVVDAVTLSPRVQHQPINTFHFEGRSLRWSLDLLNVDGWVEAAKRRRVENILVSMKCRDLISLAPSTFSCRTLVVLKLQGLCVAGSLCSVDLPSLKTLHLRHVCFQKRKDLKELLSACPVLEDLHTAVGILGGDITPEGYKTLSKLVRADICQYEVPFRALYNVEFLRISTMELAFSNEEINSYYKGFPVFPNLIHLELRSYGFHGWDFAVEVLQHCPKLQILHIKKPHFTSSLYKEDWAYPDSVPECVLSHLRRCSIINFEGLEGDLRFATYILQNATLLRVMTIRTTRSSNPMEKPQFLEELSSCTRISQACKLSFESIYTS